MIIVSMFDNFINNLKNGFRVANATRKLVFKDKELFLYPIISAVIGIAMAVLVIGIGAAIFLTGAVAGLSGGQMALIVICLLILLYFLVYMVSSYFTIAMLMAFRSYASGKKMGMAEALGRTAPYTKLIIEWSLFYTIIVTIIHIIEEAIRMLLSRYGIIGNVISGVLTGGINLALAASVAFAFPIILDEKKGPIATLKSSISFIMKNFGDTFGGLLFAEIFEIILLLVGLGLIFLGIIVYAAYSIAIPAVILAIIGIITIIAGVLLRYVLFNAFKLIIYDYKTRGTLPKGFDKSLIDASVKRKNNPKGSKPLSPFGIGTGGNI
jgi:hypothetical protein